MDANLIAADNVQYSKCEWCYWHSQFLARAGAGISGVEAYCLNMDSPQANNYTELNYTCDAYQPANGSYADMP